MSNKKIILFSRSRNHINREDISQIFSCIERYNFEYEVNRDFAETLRTSLDFNIPEVNIFDEIKPSKANTVMVCYGGDGTILEGAHALPDFSIPVVGINSGHLGFLSVAPCNEISSVFQAIAEDSLLLEKRSLLEVTYKLGETEIKDFALNEISLQRLGSRLLSVDAFVDSSKISSYQGDGVVISTPTGSTAYSLSAGGPIIYPTCDCNVITPIAAHNLTMRPVVIPSSSIIELHVNTRHNQASLTADTHSYCIEDGAIITIRSKESKISLAVPHNISFYDTLRNKMMWGVEIR